ncbi:MAG: DivIVA domain-containing protein [Clostridia bacterium]|nr:DivIVA domain-containing protein [Clostridia bacterium]
MITAEQLLNCQFTKAGMAGYKGIEVDETISQAAEAIGYYEKKIRDMQLTIDELKKNETIIQTTLVNAQRLADQITGDAQQKADAILAEAEQKAADLTKASEAEAGEKTAAAEKTAREMIDGAKAQAASLLEKAKRASDEFDRVSGESRQEQETILAAMKNEVAAFRAKLLAQYKEHLELIEKLPSEIRKLSIHTDAAASAEEPAPETGDAGSSLQYLSAEMKENETAAAQAVDEVADLTAEAEEEALAEEATAEEAPAEPAPKAHKGGFSVILDDEE